MKPIYLCKEDHQTLTQLLNILSNRSSKNGQTFDRLKTELERAVVMDHSAISDKVVRLNSRFRIRNLDEDRVEEWTLCLPNEADYERRRLSVLAPIGSAVIGFAEGDTIEWETPGGLCHLRLESVIAGEKELIPGLDLA